MSSLRAAFVRHAPTWAVHRARVLRRWWHTIAPAGMNIVLDSLGWIAITRGALYTLGSHPGDPVPRGLDLLPSWALYLYGVLWLAAGVFAIVTSRMDSIPRQYWAQRAVGSLCITWGFCYMLGAFFPPSDSGGDRSFYASLFFFWLARIAWHTGVEENGIRNDLRRLFPNLFAARIKLEDEAAERRGGR